MPWTLSHPAAILPFKRLCPKYLSFPALVIGSMSPDVGYYVSQYDAADYAHTFPGSLLLCIPAGLLLLLGLFLLRRPLWFLLPEPHRSALAPLVSARPSLGIAFILTSTVSIILGAWTHIIWD